MKDKSTAHTTTTDAGVFSVSFFGRFARVQRDFSTIAGAVVRVRVPKVVPAVTRNETVVCTVVQVAPALP